VEIIKKYHDEIDYWVSERDDGISEAFNKGIKNSTGDFLLMLNCGDIFLSDSVIDFDILSKNIDKIVAYQSQTTHGNAFPSNYVYRDDRDQNCFLAMKNSVNNAMLAHQATFVPKHVYEKIGVYDNKYRIRMDFEFFLRASKKHEIVFYNKPIVLYPTDGISSKLKNRIRFKIEELKALHSVVNNTCLRYDIYFFFLLPFYLLKKVLSSFKYTFLDWKDR